MEMDGDYDIDLHYERTEHKGPCLSDMPTKVRKNIMSWLRVDDAARLAMTVKDFYYPYEFSWGSRFRWHATCMGLDRDIIMKWVKATLDLNLTLESYVDFLKMNGEMRVLVRSHTGVRASLLRPFF